MTQPVLSPLPRIHLDPDEAAREKIAKAYRFHVVQVPSFRALGLSLVALLVLLHNVVLLPQAGWSSSVAFLAVAAVYTVLSWALLYVGYNRVPWLHLGTVFLVTDLIVFNMAIYCTGGEHSWLFFLCMVRAADQTRTTFRTTLFFGHVSTLSYLLLLLYLAWVEQRPLSWPAEGLKVGMIYASNLYLSVIAKAAEDMRSRLTAAIRVARELISQLEDQSMQLAIAKNEAEQLSQHLEQRVAERTAQLSQANAVLQEHIAERNRMEDELLKTRKIESIGVLAGGMAHDFNNILMGILGNVSLARSMTPPHEPIDQVLHIAEQACQRATDLTRQLLTFAKGGAPVRQTTSLAALIQETVSFVLHGSNVRCELALAPDLRPAEVDPGQMSQVLQNLLINADQAMPDGGVIQVQADNVCLGSETCLPLPAGRYVRVAVVDHGCGIPAEHLPRIFDPYFTTKQHGNGLGLATSYAIMRKHGGHITVTSVPQEGSTFTLYLPASSQVLPLCAPALAVTLDAPAQGRILVMDDDDMLRQLVSTMVQRLGYEVASAKDGSEALALYQKARALGRPFAAVILDLTVPGGMGGKETMAALRALDPHVQAIVSSGYATDPIMANYTHYGFQGLVAKPYTVAELSAALQRVLQDAGESRQR
ncbi:MAG: ATP-binding protein [Candidatus Tectimicrobiota bacterium]